MRPTDVLRREHETITIGLAALDTLAAKLGGGHAVPADMAASLLDFFSEFVDGSHHVKEELILFPALHRAGLTSSSGPIACMLHDHDQGRALVRAMRGLLPSLDHRAAREAFVAAAQRYRALLAHHIEKENRMLFRIADALLSDDTDAAMLAAFAAQQREPGADERAHRQAAVEELSRRCDAIG